MSPFASDRSRRQRVRGIEAVARAEILLNDTNLENQAEEQS
jgi:hypothetical protein